MSIGDWLIIGLLAVLFFFAVRYALKHKGGCGSCQNCEGCSKDCSKQKNTDDQ